MLVGAAWGVLLALASPVASENGDECQCLWKPEGNDTLVPFPSSIDKVQLDEVKLGEDNFITDFDGDMVLWDGSSISTSITIRPGFEDMLLKNYQLRVGKDTDVLDAIPRGIAIDASAFEDGAPAIRARGDIGIEARGGTGIRAFGIEGGIVVSADEGVGVTATGSTRGIHASGEESAIRAQGGAKGIHASGNETAVEAFSLSGTPLLATTVSGTAIVANSLAGDIILSGAGGGAGPPKFRVDNAGVVFSRGVQLLSDIEGKSDIRPLTDVLPKLGQIRGVSFRWSGPLGPNGRAQERMRLSVVAQEVERAFPELVSSWGEGDQKTVDLGGLTAVLVEAVKGLRLENEDLRTRLAALEQRIARGEASRN